MIKSWPWRMIFNISVILSGFGARVFGSDSKNINDCSVVFPLPQNAMKPIVPEVLEGRHCDITLAKLQQEQGQQSFYTIIKKDGQNCASLVYEKGSITYIDGKQQVTSVDRHLHNKGVPVLSANEMKKVKSIEGLYKEFQKKGYKTNGNGVFKPCESLLVVEDGCSGVTKKLRLFANGGEADKFMQRTPNGQLEGGGYRDAVTNGAKGPLGGRDR